VHRCARSFLLRLQAPFIPQQQATFKNISTRGAAGDSAAMGRLLLPEMENGICDWCGNLEVLKRRHDGKINLAHAPFVRLILCDRQGRNELGHARRKYF
jgi:hypothetical protein